MTKNLLSALFISGMFGLTAHAQTTPANTAPTGNHTAGTTTSPVDPTSKTGQAVSGTTGRSSSPRNMTPDRPSTPGNHTAGTTDNPVDPTSKMAGTAPSNDMSTRKTRKTKVRVSN